MVGMFSTLPSFAQEITEEDLVGTWELDESYGDFVYEKRCPYEIEFYTEEVHVHRSESLGVARYQSVDGMTIVPGGSTDGKYTLGIQDYFLFMTSGGDLRLHIQYKGGHFVVRYIVNSISQEKLEVMTYDKKGKAVFRRKDTSSVRGVRTNRTQSDKYYNIMGIENQTLSKGVNIVLQDDGTTKKVLNK